MALTQHLPGTCPRRPGNSRRGGPRRPGLPAAPCGGSHAPSPKLPPSRLRTSTPGSGDPPLPPAGRSQRGGVSPPRCHSPLGDTPPPAPALAARAGRALSHLRAARTAAPPRSGPITPHHHPAHSAASSPPAPRSAAAPGPPPSRPASCRAPGGAASARGTWGPARCPARVPGRFRLRRRRRRRLQLAASFPAALILGEASGG